MCISHTVCALLQAYQPATSMNAPMSGYGEPGDTVGDHIADTGSARPEDFAQARSLEQDVNKVNRELRFYCAHGCNIEEDEVYQKATVLLMRLQPCSFWARGVHTSSVMPTMCSRLPAC